MNRRILSLASALLLLLSSCHKVDIPDDVFVDAGIWTNAEKTVLFYSQENSLKAYGSGLVNGIKRRMCLSYWHQPTHNGLNLSFEVPGNENPTSLSLKLKGYSREEGTGYPVVQTEYRSGSKADENEQTHSLTLTRHPFQDVPEDPFLVPPQEEFYDADHGFSFTTLDVFGYLSQSYDAEVDGHKARLSFDPALGTYRLWRKTEDVPYVYARGSYSYSAREVSFSVESGAFYEEGTTEMKATAPERIVR